VRCWHCGADEIDDGVARGCPVCANTADAPAPAPGYWTVVIPYVAEGATEWHPTTPTGPFATLSRGAFRRITDAIVWAVTKLRGAPYTLRFTADGADH
jgi:hypothetical protein